MENDFLKHLSSSQVREIVDYMEKKNVPAGTYVIREGDAGQFVIKVVVVVVVVVKKAEIVVDCLQKVR